MTAVADCTPASTDAPETALGSRRGDAPVKIERLSRGRRLMLDILRLAAASRPFTGAWKSTSRARSPRCGRHLLGPP
jgi:hypothetical protein